MNRGVVGKAQLVREGIGMVSGEGNPGKMQRLLW